MSLTRQSLLLSLGRSSASVARLGVNLGVARLFGERLGFAAEYQNIWLVFNTSYMFFILSLPSVLFYFYPRLDGPGRRNLLSVVHQILILLGVVYGTLMWLAAPWLADFYHNPALAGHLRVFAIYSGAMVATAAMESVFNLLGRFKLLAAWLSIESLVFLVLALGPVAAGAQPMDFPVLSSWLQQLWPDLPLEGAAIRAACWLLGGMAVLKWAGFQLILARRHPDMAWHPVRFVGKTLRPLINYAVPITATSLVAYLASYMDKNIVAATFADKSIFAVFQAGAMEVPFVSVLVGSVSVVMLPHLSRLQHEGRHAELAALLAQGVEKVAWLVFPIFTLLMVLADPLYIAFWGPSYAASAIPFRIYLLLFPLRLMFYGQVLNTLGYQRWVLGTAAADLVLNISLSLLFVRIAWFGPAISTVLATSAEVVVFWWLLRRGLGVPIRQIFVPGRLGRIAGYALLAGVAALVGRLLGRSPLEMILLGLLLHALVYLALVWRAGFGILIINHWRARKGG